MAQQSSKPFPRRCFTCGERTVERSFEQRTVRPRYEGIAREVSLEMPIERCSSCGATTLDNEADAAVNRALREHLGLLQPEEIRSGRESLGLTQQQLAARIGCAAETLSRWESDAIIQSRASDRMLRLYFNLPSAREFLEELDRGERLAG